MTAILTEKAKDRIAAALIRCGGVLVILTVVAIVANIGMEALPLLGGASAHRLDDVTAQDPPLLVGTDPRQEGPWILGGDGVISFETLPDREPLKPFNEPVSLVTADIEIHDLITLLDDQGRIAVGKVRLRDHWENGQRHTTARWRPSADILQLDPQTPWNGATANSDSDGNLMVLAWSPSQAPVLFFWDGEIESWEPQALGLSNPITTGAVAMELGAIAVVDAYHGLKTFTRDRTDQWTERLMDGFPEAISRVRFLIGGGTLVAAGLDGSVTVGFSVPHVSVTNTGSKTLKIAGFTIDPGETAILPDDEIGSRLASVPSAKLESAPAVMTAIRTLPGV
ncbi:MAG: hypothetical protein DRH08_14120, partial [Deltaproteobacteria bacterium]